MRYVFLNIIIVSLLYGGALYASPEVSHRQEIQRNVQQLLEKKSCPGCNLSGAALQRTDLVGANLEGANLAGAQLNQAILSGANMKNANLQGANLVGADLAGADLTGANLIGTLIKGAHLAGTKLGGEVIIHKSTTEKDGPDDSEKIGKEAEAEEESRALPVAKRAVVMVNKTGRKTPVQDEKAEPAEESTPESTPSMQQPNADPVPEQSKQLNKIEEVVVIPKAEPQQAAQAKIDQVVETEVEVNKEEEIPGEPVVDPEAEKKKLLVEKLLDENRCVGCDLSGVDLSDRDLEEADLERVNLRGANLREVDLEGANLKGADLSDTDLRDADLREADLYKADLSNANLTGVKFDEALIDSMISTGAIGADFKGAIGNTLSSPFLRN